MFLSQLKLETRSREVRRDLGDVHEMHRTLLRAFGQVDGPARASVGLLYRVETDRQGVCVLAQSKERPAWGQLPPGYLGAPAETKEIERSLAALHDGMTLRFRLTANPTRKIDTKSGPNGEHRNGMRVELRKEEDQLAWLERKGAVAGFRLVTVQVEGVTAGGREGTAPIEVRVTPGPKEHDASWAKAHGNRRPKGATVEDGLTFGVARFEGRLEVTDAEALRTAVMAGIGSGKAYGFGLLSLAPAG